MSYIDSQKKLAAAINTHPNLLSRFKKERPNNRSRPLSEEAANSLCKRLGVTMFELLSMSKREFDRHMTELFTRERARKMRL